MTIAKSFVEYMEDQLLGVFGTDIFIGSVPLNAQDDCYWIVSSGGNPVNENQTGEMLKQYNLNVYFRSLDAEKVDTNMQALEELINADLCTQLNGFDTMDLKATAFPSDQDIDNEERTVGLLQVTVQTYYKE